MALKNKKKKNDFILAGIFLAIALIYFASGRIRADHQAPEAIITINGETQGTYRLSDGIDDMMLETGIKNGIVHIAIRDGGISITQSSCPDKVCVKQGTIGQSGQTIVCLPNQLVVTIP